MLATNWELRNRTKHKLSHAISHFRVRRILVALVLVSWWQGHTGQLFAQAVSAKANVRGVFGAAPTASAVNQQRAPADAWRDEATLRDICFVDPQHGWIAGDLGVIWHTDNGGAQWRRQHTPVDVRLNCVYFLDQQQGWAVGGRFVPASTRHDGVILRTTDGGVTWTEVPGVFLPALQRVRFADARRGWATGLENRQFSTQIFQTNDGGRSWTAMPGDSTSSIIAMDFPAESDGSASSPLIVDRQGAVLATMRGQLRRISQLSAPIAGHSADLKFATPEVAVLVNGNHPQLTTSAGEVWFELPTFPRIGSKEFRLTAASANGTSMWFAGTPGSCIWRSVDRAQTWEAVTTGESLPLHAIHFASETHGWAAGESGTILHTDDAGQTWRRQRGGNTRLAALVVCARATTVPCDLIAQLSAADEYRVHVISAFQDLPEGGLLDDSFAPLDACGVPVSEQRLTAAMSVLGASSSQLTRWSAGSSAARPALRHIIAEWDIAIGGSSVAWLLEQLVREIRVRKPSVVVLGNAEHDVQNELLQRVVSEAVRLAADETAFVDQISSAGLSVWQTERLVREIEGADAKTTSSETDTNSEAAAQQISLAAGRTVGDLTLCSQTMLQRIIPPRPLVTRHSRKFASFDHDSLLAPGLATTPSSNSAPRKAAIRTTQQRWSGSELFQGIVAPYGSPVRRARHRGNEGLQVRQPGLDRRTAEAMLLAGDRLATSGAQLLEQFEPWTQTLSADDAGDLLFQLAIRFAANDQLSLAEATFVRYLERYSQHPLREAAWAWLIRYKSSSEIAWHQARMTSRSAATETSVRLAGVEQPAELDDVAKLAASRISTTHLTNEVPAQQVIAAWATALRRQDPKLYSEPQIRLALGSVFRSSDREKESLSFYKQLLAAPGSSWWQDIAAREVGLSKITRDAAEQVSAISRDWRCVRTTSAPYLDAVLDDAVWNSAQPVRLTSMQTNLSSYTRETQAANTNEHATPGDGVEDRADSNAATVLWAYDSDYLYLAAKCPLITDVTYVAGRRPRPRDADLQNHDRLQFAIDTNRDYQSAWLLEVDQRGWTAESLLGNTGWNPQWFVASAKDDREWTVEIAIPWNELTPTPPARGEAWAMEVRRVIPTVGVQTSISEPTSASAPTRLLVFE